MNAVCQILTNVTDMRSFHKVVQISPQCTLGTGCPSLTSVGDCHPLKGVVSVLWC